MYDGVLGCPNCRDSFPVRDGFGDLRAPPRGDLADGLAGAPADEPADVRQAAGERLLALLGVVGGRGTVALIGGPARYADLVADALPEIQVVGVDPDLRHWSESARVSRLVATPGLPFFDATVRAVAADARLGALCLSEAGRVVAPRGRVVVTEAREDVAASLEAKGLEVLAAEAETVVAARG